MKRIKDFFGFKDLQALISFFALIAALNSTEKMNTVSLVVAIIILGLSISTSIYNAEIIAKRVGPSVGTLILALSVTIIEVAMIVNIMSNSVSAAPSIARDTVFAAIMIVTNGIVGVSILVGGLKHKELGFQALGTGSLIAVLATLATLTMVLPNFTTTTNGPTYNERQLIFVSATALFMYVALVWAQTKTYKNYFEPLSEKELKKLETNDYVPSRIKAIVSFFGLIISLVTVVGFAKLLSPSIANIVDFMGAPQATVGIIVAILVLAPEAFAAFNAAKINQLQTSLNLALGSGAASIALTVPVVSIYSIIANQNLILGIDNKSIVFLILTFIAAGFTFGAGRTTVLHGIVHLVIMFSYLLLSFIP